MFRHERPQKGRYRQFHQIGAEAFGVSGPDIEAELIAVSACLWKRLGLERVRLTLNSLGATGDRERYRAALVEYLKRHEEALDEDSKRRLETNPLRVLDSKVESTREILSAAPYIIDFLNDESQAHFSGLRKRLGALGINHEIDPFLVRGLDYYTGTVFEWTTDALGAQDAVCSGGRYDGLVEQLGGRPTPAVGWALGMERLILLAEAHGNLPKMAAPHAYLVALGEAAECEAIVLAERLREQLPRLRLTLNVGAGSMKAQLRRANRLEAELALIVGDAELADRKVTLKFLRRDAEQKTVAIDDLPHVLMRRIENAG